MHYFEKDNQFVFVSSLLQVIPTEFVKEILNLTRFGSASDDPSSFSVESF